MRLKFKLENSNSNCASSCNGKGECVGGKCNCYPGFSGDDCSFSKIHRNN